LWVTRDSSGAFLDILLGFGKMTKVTFGRFPSKWLQCLAPYQNKNQIFLDSIIEPMYLNNGKFRLYAVMRMLQNTREFFLISKLGFLTRRYPIG
jgi:hypothetical protein